MTSMNEQLVKYLTDAHAVEQHVSRHLDTMRKMTDDPEMAAHLEQHKAETERHKQLLEERLTAHGASPSAVKETGQTVLALSAGLANVARHGNAGTTARDGFAAEHMEIATYQLLERVARFAGDDVTIAVAQRIRAEEEAMAAKIAASWDKIALESLRQEGVELPAPVRTRGTSPPSGSTM